MGSSQADAAATVRGGRTIRSAPGGACLVGLAWSGAGVAGCLRGASALAHQFASTRDRLCTLPCRRDIGKFDPTELTNGFGSISDMHEETAAYCHGTADEKCLERRKRSGCVLLRYAGLRDIAKSGTDKTEIFTDWVLRNYELGI